MHNVQDNIFFPLNRDLDHPSICFKSSVVKFPSLQGHLALLIFISRLCGVVPTVNKTECTNTITELIRWRFMQKQSGLGGVTGNKAAIPTSVPSVRVSGRFRPPSEQ